MKKFALFLLASLLLPLQACAETDDVKWEEGTHYTVLDHPATSKPTVYEFASFWCGHCFRFEPVVAEIKKALPDNAKFTKIHVNFMPGASQDIQDDATRAMVIGRVLEREDELNGAIFNYIHQQRASVGGMADLKNIFVVNDVDPDEFDKLAKPSNFSVDNMVKKNQKIQEQYRNDVNATPTFIVNGKYKANFVKGMSFEDVTDLIVWLSEQ